MKLSYRSLPVFFVVLFIVACGERNPDIVQLPPVEVPVVAAKTPMQKLDELKNNVARAMSLDELAEIEIKAANIEKDIVASPGTLNNNLYMLLDMLRQDIAYRRTFASDSGILYSPEEYANVQLPRLSREKQKITADRIAATVQQYPELKSRFAPIMEHLAPTRRVLILAPDAQSLKLLGPLGLDSGKVRQMLAASPVFTDHYDVLDSRFVLGDEDVSDPVRALKILEGRPAERAPDAVVTIETSRSGDEVILSARVIRIRDGKIDNAATLMLSPIDQPSAVLPELGTLLTIKGQPQEEYYRRNVRRKQLVTRANYHVSRNELKKAQEIYAQYESDPSVARMLKVVQEADRRGDKKGSDVDDMVVSVSPPSRQKVSVVTDKEIYRVGERINLKIKSEVAGYLQIVNESTDGEVVMLFPNKFVTEKQIPAGQEISIPSKDDGFELIFEGRPGVDRIIVTVSPEKIAFSQFENKNQDAFVGLSNTRSIKAVKKMVSDNAAASTTVSVIMQEAE